MNHAQQKLNHAQKLLTAEQLKTLPPLYSTDGQGYQARAIVKFFAGPFTWFATEYDPKEGLFFGLAYNAHLVDQMPHGELGYFSADELCETKFPLLVNGRRIGTFSIERDIHFEPKPLANALEQLTGRKLEAPAVNEPHAEQENPPIEQATVAEFDALDPAAHEIPKPARTFRTYAEGWSTIFGKTC